MTTENNHFITCDLGNTRSSFALWSKGEIIKMTENFSEVESNASHIIISSVTDNKLKTSLKKTLIRDYRTSDAFLDMPIHYSETLGEDRYVQAYPFFKRGEKITLIDAGTFITVDYIDEKGMHGGAILPGLGVIKKSYTHAKKLFEPQRITHKKSFFTHSTEEAIELGAAKAFSAPVMELIQNSERVIITGGDGITLSELIGQKEVVPHLIHQSLYFINEAL